MNSDGLLWLMVEKQVHWNTEITISEIVTMVFTEVALCFRIHPWNVETSANIDISISYSKKNSTKSSFNQPGKATCSWNFIHSHITLRKLKSGICSLFMACLFLSTQKTNFEPHQVKFTTNGPGKGTFFSTMFWICRLQRKIYARLVDITIGQARKSSLVEYPNKTIRTKITHPPSCVFNISQLQRHTKYWK